MNKFLLILTTFASSLFLISCDDDDAGTGMDEVGSLSLSVSGLEDLGDDYVYEGWVIVDGAPVSTGVFTVDANGAASPSSFSVAQSDLDAATMFVVSIEPATDPDPAPADTKVLSGSMVSGSASLTSGLIGDFSNAAGSFFLRTPTDETDGNNGNDENGVWFGVPGMPPTAGFTLPTLPAGWTYEGWVVGDAGPITTGVFTAFGTADASAPYSGTQPGPPIPGEDFLNNTPTGETFPLDVRNRTVVISVEPVPDNSPAPFAIKPLTGTAGTDTAPTTYQFMANLASLPTGSVVVQ